MTKILIKLKENKFKVIKENLLMEKLISYKENNLNLNPIRYNRNFVFNLFKEYKEFGMTEHSYCCYGEETSCWCEVVEKGVWDLNLKEVRSNILSAIKGIKHILRSIHKYGNRMYIYKDKSKCCIYIYCRDLFQIDYHIWFSN
jgi:hypothetical protein